jgi:HlyD family secretion protein
MKHWIRNIVVLVLVAVLLAAGTQWYQRRKSTTESTIKTAPVTRGEVVQTIGATGTLQPEEVINVGAQVAGRITEFGKDTAGKTVDYGSEVAQGTVLALIDPDVYQSDVDSAQAQLGSAMAGVDRAIADAAQFEAKYKQAERDWARAQKLGSTDALAQVDYDNYQSAYESAKANVAVSKASIEQAKRAVAQAQASVDRAQRNLAFCTITAPVKGVVIDRRVNIGQTVVASLNAPSLFLLAKDLHRMQVWVAVNEADIGSIRTGQPVTFTVDAFPGRTFKGEVGKVRLNASMTQNVVTYTVEVTTDNASGTLLPYLTANVQFEVSRREDVLTVPNAALRWTPQEDQVAPDVREAMAAKPAESGGASESRGGRGGEGRRGAGGRRSTSGPSTQQSNDSQIHAWRSGTVWVRDDQFVRPIEVRAGTTDGVVTEVMGEGLNEGTEIIVSSAQPDSRSSAAAAPNTNPFAPRMGGSGGSRGGGSRGPRL